MQENIAEKLLELAKTKVGKAEVVFSQGQSREISFEESKLKNIETHFGSSLGLRVIKQGKIGVAATNKLEEAEGLVEKAKATAEFGPRALFEFPGPQPFPKPKTYNPKTIKILDKSLVSLGWQIVDDFKKFNPKIQTNLGFSVGEGESLLLNSQGLKVQTQRSSLDFSVWFDLVKEGDMLQVGEGQKSRQEDIDYAFYLTRAKEKIRQAQRIVKIKTGKYPVVFTPDSVGEILDYVTVALNGKTLVKGSSKLAKSLGEKVFDEKLSIFDNGTLDWKMGSTPCDSDGVVVQPLNLVEKGVVKNFYFDLQTAAQARARSTGHGGRGKAAALSVPGLHNVLIKEGAEPFGSMIKNIQEGILAEQFLGAGQDNPYNGDFSMNLSLGYKIENGEIVGRVKDTMIAGNAFDLLRNNLLAISKEREWVGNSFLCPYFLLDGISIASK